MIYIYIFSRLVLVVLLSLCYFILSSKKDLCSTDSIRGCHPSGGESLEALPSRSP